MKRTERRKSGGNECGIRLNESQGRGKGGGGEKTKEGKLN